MSSPAVIRRMRPDDREVVGRIAYQTGFFGESAARYFPARRLFERLWVGPYFQEPCPNGFVAEMEGGVLGYILGSHDQRRYQAALLRTVAGSLGAALFPFAPVWRSLPYLVRAARFPTPHGDWAQYPAHLHINLLPQARGQRLGERLLRAYLADLQAAGISGVQLSTTTENRAAIRLYEKFGFQVLASRVTGLWVPWLGHSATHVIMGRSLPSPKEASPGGVEG